MCAGRGNRDRPLGHFLASDIGEVFVVSRQLFEELFDPRGSWINRQRPRKKTDRLGQTGDGDHLDLLHDGSFAGAFGGDHEPPQADLPRRRHRHRERAAHRPRRSIEREFAHHGVLGKQLRLQLTAAGEHTERDRQIERRRLLGQLCRGEIPCATRWRRPTGRPNLPPAVASLGGNLSRKLPPQGGRIGSEHRNSTLYRVQKRRKPRSQGELPRAGLRNHSLPRHSTSRQTKTHHARPWQCETTPGRQPMPAAGLQQ
jgi:hypothetical protein